MSEESNDPPDGPTQEFSDSTIGMSAYNVLCMHNGRTMQLDVILLVIKNMQHAYLEDVQLQRAMNKLIELRRIMRNADGSYQIVAKEGLFVIARDKSDYNEQTMTGGWNGWMVKDPRIRDGVGARPLQQLLPVKVEEVNP